VSRFHRDHFLQFLGARYRPNRILVAAAGDLPHEELVDVVDRNFGALAGSAPSADGGPPEPRPGVSIHEKDLEQVHLCLGTPGIAQLDPDRYAAHLMNLALGGGMSSRLFQEIRERRGKAYTVYSFLSSYLDAGYTGFYVGTSAEWVREVVDVIRGELERVTRDGLTPDELGRVKNQMKGNMLLGLETSDSRMSRLAKNAIYFGRDVTLEEVAAGIDGVTNADVVRVCRRLFQPQGLALTVLGDLRGAVLDDGVLRG
jgi:predicted Zn-dependent peptidase